MIELTNQLIQDQIAQHLSACMDSVNLLQAGKPEGMSDVTWAASVRRNKQHLQIMLAKDFWTTEDLTPLRDAMALYPEIIVVNRAAEIEARIKALEEAKAQATT